MFDLWTNKNALEKMSSLQRIKSATFKISSVTINKPLETIFNSMSLVTIEAFLLMGCFSSKCSLGGSNPKD
ncbi:MAG: hypothetical protein JL57_07945 [Desulfosporosinus sp. BICA1-9]|nr:MAG: hypothetical protein JL57_07945 [Desulfosporosinus sp. BICA1-9]